MNRLRAAINGINSSKLHKTVLLKEEVNKTKLFMRESVLILLRQLDKKLNNKD